MRPKKIKKINDFELTILWDDEHQSRYALEHLRNACPCAGCQGETILLREYSPPSPDMSAAGRYELTGIQQVGSYAIQLTWADGHSTGIYTWEQLKDLCECEECLRKKVHT
ncbi:MAG: DUF971 domain-containing protein [Ignavibacteriae bacterium]|nr:DUF971 domain-containing protein [Ignavibacteria bacterium]MBI3365743.1 DUF971 domain-containing protein [Ignavibacteriota bacterium]